VSNPDKLSKWSWDVFLDIAMHWNQTILANNAKCDTYDNLRCVIVLTVNNDMYAKPMVDHRNYESSSYDPPFTHHNDPTGHFVSGVAPFVMVKSEGSYAPSPSTAATALTSTAMSLGHKGRQIAEWFV
jgi:hypothetical protein